MYGLLSLPDNAPATGIVFSILALLYGSPLYREYAEGQMSMIESVTSSETQEMTMARVLTR